MNSLLSHKTRRYGRWNFIRFINEIGTSQFICFSERNAAGIIASGGDPKQALQTLQSSLQPLFA